MLPQQFRDWFEDPTVPCREISIDDPQLIECVPPPCHTGKGGLHSNQDGAGTNWNAVWRKYITEHPNACKNDVLQQLTFMRQMFSGPLNCQ